MVQLYRKENKHCYHVAWYTLAVVHGKTLASRPCRAASEAVVRPRGREAAAEINITFLEKMRKSFPCATYVPMSIRLARLLFSTECLLCVHYCASNLNQAPDVHFKDNGTMGHSIS